MKEERLEEFMQNIKIINDKISIYENKEKGLSYPTTTVSLLCRVDTLELEKGNPKQPGKLERAIFEQKIENKEYKIEEIEKIVPKYEITKNEADKYTLTTKKVKGAKIYNVSNQLGILNSYQDNESAFKLCEEINKKVLGYIK